VKKIKNNFNDEKVGKDEPDGITTEK